MKKLEQHQRESRKKPSLKAISRFIAIIVMGIALILGIVFSSSAFADHYTLGQDFSDRYQAWVGVYNSKADERPTNDNQPNGDATKGAKILAERLNPLGMKDIRIAQGGANYLQVTAPSSQYNSIQEFRNNIQRSGSVVMTDSTFSDVQLGSDDNSRTPLSDYFSEAKATTRTVGATKSPFISYTLNGSTFKDLVSSKTSSSNSNGQAQEFDMYIFTDLDELFSDVRTFFNVDSSEDEDTRYSDFYDHLFVPLKKIYDASDTNETTKKFLYDMFYGKYENEQTSSGTKTTSYGSLITDTFNVNGDINGAIAHASDVEKLFKNYSFSYLSETSNYVYDGEAKTDDFKDDGKYAEDVRIHTSGSAGNTSKSDVNILGAFKALAPSILQTVFSSNQNSSIANYFVSSYVLFTGSVSADATSSDSSFFEDSNFFTKVKTQSIAKTGASIFNAAGEGFSFVTSSVTQIKSSISETRLLIALVILIIMLLALFVFMIILYRLLAIFTIIIAVTAVAATAAIMTAFGLTIGLEAILGAIILIAVAFEIATTLFSLIKHNVFNKKRGIKTSFKIAVKDAIAYGVDLLIVLIISSVCLFWVGTNALKSLATILSIGSAMEILLSIIFGMIWMKLLVDTDIFDKARGLFILNVDTESRYAFQEFRISHLTDKIHTYQKNNKPVDALTQKLNLLTEKLDANKAKQDLRNDKADQKQLDRIQTRIKKIEAKMMLLRTPEANKAVEKEKEKALNKLDHALAKLMKKKEQLVAANLQKRLPAIESKIVALETSKITISEKTLLSNKNERRLNNLKRKLDELQYEYSAEGRMIQSEQDETEEHAYTITERRQIKENERVMKLGSRIMLIIFGIFIVIGAILFPTVGVKLDKTFGGAVVYTVWGNDLIMNESMIKDIADDTTMPSWYRDEAKALLEDINQYTNAPSTETLADSYYIATAKKFGTFVLNAITNSTIYATNTFGYADIPKGMKAAVTSGINYINNVSDTSAQKEANMWIAIEANAADVKQSRGVKQVIRKIVGTYEDIPVSADSGFTSKRLHPYTNQKMLVEAVVVGALAILILLIYIIIRFKWTYYVALALSLLFTLAMTIVSIVAFHINIDLSTIMLATVGFLIALYLGLYAISSIRSIMNRKDEKSLTKYFEKEITVAVGIKKQKKHVRDLIWQKRSAIRSEIKLNKENLSKEEIKALKAQIKTYKIQQKAELKTYMQTKKEEVRRESRRNNYLFEVVSQIFERLWKKVLVLAVFAIIITIALFVGLTGNISNAFIFIIAFIISSATCLFILIPLWVRIERFRIHNRLASKRFIHQIVISQEEQLVEDIND